jgi:hypothetical protein
MRDAFEHDAWRMPRRGVNQARMRGVLDSHTMPFGVQRGRFDGDMKIVDASRSFNFSAVTRTRVVRLRISVLRTIMLRSG